MTDPKHQAFLEDLMAVFVRHGLQISSMDPVYIYDMPADAVGALFDCQEELHILTADDRWGLNKKRLADPKNKASFEFPTTAHGRLA